jgi:phenylalanine-4-hydroxylase
MKQNYNNYTKEDQEVWTILFERQAKNLNDKACVEYLNCLDEMNSVLNEKRIPKFNELNTVLKQKTGWSIEVVPGLIPVDDFFKLLAQKKFCSSTWLRKKSQLDYLEEPDMFHDIFGHIPLFMNDVFADFVHRFGLLGVKHLHNPNILTQLQRLYWFTIEFGLFNQKNCIYGAGIISSFGESNHIFNDSIEVIPFDINKVLKQDFINSEIQQLYFSINSFDELYNSISEAEKIFDNNEVAMFT